MGNMGPYLVGAAFWLFIGAVSVAGIVADHKRRRFGVDLLRSAIEKGQTLDPAVVDKLMSFNAHEQRLDPSHLKLGGIITIAAGIGVSMLSYFIGQVRPIAFYPILGAGTVAICVGIGLLIGSRVLAEGERTRKPS